MWKANVKTWFAISVILLAMAPFPISAFGQCDEDDYYWVAGTGDWSTPENWVHYVLDPESGECVPKTGIPQADDIAIIDNGGTAIITGSAYVRGIGLRIGTLIQNGSLNADGVDISGESTFVQTGGNVTLGGLGLDGQGTYELHQGSLDANLVSVGGTFVQTGGNVTISGYDGPLINVRGTYELHQGSLNVNRVGTGGTYYSVGVAGGGTFIQTGGNVTIRHEDWYGSLTLDGGSYELDQGSLDVQGIEVANGGAFIQTGGTVISESIMLYHQGTYEFHQDSLHAKNGIAVGDMGTFIQTGGSITSDMVIVYDKGTYELQQGIINAKEVRISGGLFVMNEGIINGTTEDSILWVSTVTNQNSIFIGSLTGPGTFNINVVYQELLELGVPAPFRGVAIGFLPNCLTEGGAFRGTQITPADFAGGNVPNLLESYVFDVSFDGSFCGEFTIKIIYNQAEVDALGVDETSLVILQETGPGTYERLDDITVNEFMWYPFVSAKAHTFGKFAVAYVAIIPGDLLLGEGAKIVPGPWSHIGMYIGNGQVVESHIALGGVAITPLESWFERYKTWAILRVASADNEIREKAIEWATHPDQLDDPYDLMWWQKDPDGKAWYCSEFIWAAYYNASNGQINLEYHGPWEFLEGGITPYEILLDEETVVIDEHYEDTSPKGLVIATKSPVDLKIVDPGNFSVTKQLIEIPEAIYGEDDIDGDGSLEDWIGIPERRIGVYIITVIPEPNASQDDTYSLEVTIDDQTMVLAKDVRIQDIPAEPYQFESKLNRSDLDGDGDVDFADYAMFASHWMNVACNYPSWCEGTDIDYSGFIDFNDLGIFVGDWLWEKISADVDIDGNVDFFDYAILVNYWMAENCAEHNWCDGADLNKSGEVDIFDMGVLAEHWLEGTTP